MTHTWSIRGVLCLALLGAATVAPAGDSIWGKVTAVKEPTLVTLDYGTGSYEIRLVGVDAPKAGEALYGQAVAFVSGLVLNKNARMRLDHRSANNELVCRLFTDDAEIGIKEVGLVEYRFQADSFEVRHVRAPGQADVDLDSLIGTAAS